MMNRGESHRSTVHSYIRVCINLAFRLCGSTNNQGMLIYKFQLFSMCYDVWMPEVTVILLTEFYNTTYEEVCLSHSKCV